MFVYKLFILIILWVYCVKSQYVSKAGDCPPPVEIGVCRFTCRYDFHCSGETKCCRTSCGGAVCTRPVTARISKSSSDKKGSCPAEPSGPWVCSSRCAFDADCRGTKKCCKNRCGAMACIKPDMNMF